jgi:hypothetical protein
MASSPGMSAIRARKPPCPEYTAPATTAVPGPSLADRVLTSDPGILIMLLDGVTPQNGFMVMVESFGGGGLADSPLEGTGFEPSVPLLRKALLGLPIGDGGMKGGATYRFRSETAMLAWSGCP